MGQALIRTCSVEEYFAWEETSEIKHEYLGGEVYAMSGATDAHGRIALNIASSLHAQFRGGPCEAFVADMKVRCDFKGSDYIYYPDVMVCCDPADNAPLFRERPTVLIEVLSDSTQRTDRREKWVVYSSIPTLRNYILVEQDKRHVTLFRTTAEGQTTCEEITAPEAEFALDEVSARLNMSEIYERVSFTGE